ncbi:MAG: hypothetical protein R2814_08660 [Flavobacteriaceae bacterium]
MKTIFIFLSVLFLIGVVIGFTTGANDKKERELEKEIINYIPQPGISLVNGKLVWEHDHSLPNPYAYNDGSIIATTGKWEVRRDTLLRMMEEYVYGLRPDLKIDRVEITIPDYHDKLVSDNAISFHAQVYYDLLRSFNIRVTRPRKKGNYPVIIRYESNEDFRFPIEEDCIGNNKYIIVALNHMSVSPDNDEVTNDHMYETKVLMAWAYAASLTVDYLETLDFVDATNITITGMSRTGKAAICAGVYDKRFKVVVANNSGAAGASGLRSFGEAKTQAINIAKHQPTWVSEILLKYLDDENRLPLDMHFARALIAPRAIFTTEASDGGDAIWAGPVSTFKMWEASDYAFHLYEEAKHNLIHLRKGPHDQLDEDYERMMLVVDHVCYNQPLDTSLFRVNAYK